MQYIYKGRKNVKPERFIKKLMELTDSISNKDAGWNAYCIKFEPYSMTAVFEVDDLTEMLVITTGGEERKIRLVSDGSSETHFDTYVPTPKSEKKILEVIKMIMSGSEDLINGVTDPSGSLYKMCTEQFYDPKFLTLVND